MRLLLLNGPNLNLLGTRQPDVYGSTSLSDIEGIATDHAERMGATLEAFQSNHEGALIDRIHEARDNTDGIVFNPGALTHTSYALRDAIDAIEIPTVEVHVSNIKARESWRAISLIAPATVRQIFGRGVRGYTDAISHLVCLAALPPKTLAYGTGPDQVGDLRIPDGGGPYPVVVLFHGGFWRQIWGRDLMDRLSVDLTQRGYATWNVEFRRIPPVGGWRATVGDAVAALEFVAEFAESSRLDLTNVQTIGHSAGAQLGIFAAVRADRVQVIRAISLAGVLDVAACLSDDEDNGVRRFLGREVDTHVDAVSPIANLPNGVRQLVVHGTKDEAVSQDNSARYAAAAVEAGDSVETLWLDGVDHMDVIDPESQAWAQIVAAL